MSFTIAQTPAFIEGGEMLIRLVMLSLEIAIFVCILELLIRLRAIRSPRLIAILYGFVFVKCSLGLLVPPSLLVSVLR